MPGINWLLLVGWTTVDESKTYTLNNLRVRHRDLLDLFLDNS